MRIAPLFSAALLLGLLIALPVRAQAPAERRYPAPAGERAVVVATRPFRAELWLLEGDAPPRLLLRADGETFGDVAWHPDGRAFTFTRAPLGTETASAAETWRFDLPTGRAVRLRAGEHAAPPPAPPPLP
ncbi:MAG: hypothetical protein D6796_06020, partial [Caldilineae bacterium]